jgi:hypothetical protein
VLLYVLYLGMYYKMLCPTLLHNQHRSSYIK